MHLPQSVNQIKQGFIVSQRLFESKEKKNCILSISTCIMEAAFPTQLSGLPRSMPNADQYWSMLIKIGLLIPMPIKNDQLITIDLYWEVFWINSRILIGIDRYWSALGIDWGSPELCWQKSLNFLAKILRQPCSSETSCPLRTFHLIPAFSM